MNALHCAGAHAEAIPKFRNCFKRLCAHCISVILAMTHCLNYNGTCRINKTKSEAQGACLVAVDAEKPGAAEAVGEAADEPV